MSDWHESLLASPATSMLRETPRGEPRDGRSAAGADRVSGMDGLAARGTTSAAARPPVPRPVSAGGGIRETGSGSGGAAFGAAPRRSLDRAALLRGGGLTRAPSAAKVRWRGAVNRIINLNRLQHTQAKKRRHAHSIPLAKSGSLFDLLTDESGALAPDVAGSSRSLGSVASSATTGSALDPDSAEDPRRQKHRLKLAARFVIDALEGRTLDVGRSGRDSVPRFLKSKVYRYSLLFISLVQMLLVLLEPTPANDPPADAFYWQVTYGELLIIAIYFVDITLNLYAFGPNHFTDKKWDLAFVCVTVIMLIDWIIVYPLGYINFFRISRALRPVQLISKKKTLRRLAAVMLRTFPKMFDLAGVFFTALIVYAILGAQMFNDQHVPPGPYGYQANNDNFNNVGNAALAMYIFTTTENYPTVMYPALQYRPVPSCVYFFSGIFFFLWLLVPLWLAIVYDHYRDVRAQQVTAERVKEKKMLLVAYHVLHDDGGALMNYDMFARFVRYLPNVSKSKSYRTRFMFRMLDGNGNGYISVREFLQLKKVMSLKYKRKRAPEPSDNEVSCLRRLCRAILRGRLFWWATTLAVFGTIVTGVMWTLPAQYAIDSCEAEKGWTACTDQYLSRVEQVSLALLLVGCLEMVVKITARSWRFFENMWNCFDLAVVVYCTVSTVALLGGIRHYVNWWVLELFQLSWALRSTRLISVVPRFRAVIGTLLSIMRITLRISVVYTGVTYAFAIVGMYILPDVPGDGSVLTQLEEGQIYSMRTFLAAMYCLLQLTVGNNWNSIVYPNVIPTNRTYALFFSAYFVVCTTVLMNIVTGVIIEAYCLSEQQKKEGRVAVDTKDADEGEHISWGDDSATGAKEPLLRARADSGISMQSSDGIRLARISESHEAGYEPPRVRGAGAGAGAGAGVGTSSDPSDDEWHVQASRDWQKDLSADDVAGDFSKAELDALAKALDEFETALIARKTSGVLGLKRAPKKKRRWWQRS